MGGGKKGGKGGGKKGAKGAKGGKGGMAKRRGMMPMAGADGVGMTPRGMKNRRNRLNAERRMEDRHRHAEAEAQEKEKEEEEEGEEEPSPSGLPAEEKLELLLYVWKN